MSDKPAQVNLTDSVSHNISHLSLMDEKKEDFMSSLLTLVNFYVGKPLYSQKDDIVTQIKNLLDNSKSITSINEIVILVAPLMRIAANFKQLSGGSKKFLVIDILKSLVKNSSNYIVTKNNLCSLIDIVIPSLIDEFYVLKKSDFKKMLLLCC